MAEIINLDAHSPDALHIAQAAEVLRGNGIIVYPTDTIYGLGCDIASRQGIARIQQIKGRNRDKPMSIVCADLVHAHQFAHVSEFAYRLLENSLPGPYTFILPATSEIPPSLQSAQQTVGLRVPDHPVPLAIVEALRSPVVSTSANRSQAIPINTPATLEATLGREVDLILECGALSQTASSVISLIGDTTTILRRGTGDLSLFERR